MNNRNKELRRVVNNYIDLVNEYYVTNFTKREMIDRLREIETDLFIVATGIIFESEVDEE